MKKIYAILLMVVTMGLFSTSGSGQTIQEFGTGVHEDLDHLIEMRSICVPNPTKDTQYDFNKSFSANVNDAIKRERSAFGNTKIGEYVHPTYYTDPVDYAHKIITALRQAYSKAYNIEVIDIPLDLSVINASQNHSCKMISCNQFTHSSSCTGSPKSRLEEQVGDWGSCLMGYSENIAINTSKTIEGSMEWAIFGMMYDDLACCHNGHRENFLKCTYDKNWRMGFGYKKGKYSFGTSRSYDSWFMTWDYAKIGRTSGCSWNKDNGAGDCAASKEVVIQDLKVSGQDNCSNLKSTWSASNGSLVSNFEVYQSTDGKSYSKVATVSPNSGNSYSTTFNTGGSEAKIFVKAITKEGGFYASEIVVFNVSGCKPADITPAPKPEPDTTKDVTENNDPPSTPKPEPEPEVDPSKIVVAPNPATNSIKLNDVPYGSLYWITTLQGRFAMIGYYRNNINISRLRPGIYVISVRGKSGQFVKL